MRRHELGFEGDVQVDVEVVEHPSDSNGELKQVGNLYDVFAVILVRQRYGSRGKRHQESFVQVCDFDVIELREFGLKDDASTLIASEQIRLGQSEKNVLNENFTRIVDFYGERDGLAGNETGLIDRALDSEMKESCCG